MSEIVVDTSGMKRLAHALHTIPDKAELAMKRGTKRALAAAKTIGARRAQEIYTVKGVRLTRQVKAGENSLRVVGPRRPLMDFEVRPRTPTKGARVFARVKVTGGGSLPHAFVSRMPSTGHVGVYERVGQRRYPIRQLNAVSAPQMMGEPQVLLAMEERASQVLEERVLHEAMRFLEE